LKPRTTHLVADAADNAGEARSYSRRNTKRHRNQRSVTITSTEAADNLYRLSRVTCINEASWAYLSCWL